MSLSCCGAGPRVVRPLTGQLWDSLGLPWVPSLGSPRVGEQLALVTVIWTVGWFWLLSLHLFCLGVVGLRPNWGGTALSATLSPLTLGSPSLREYLALAAP